MKHHGCNAYLWRWCVLTLRLGWVGHSCPTSDAVLHGRFSGAIRADEYIVPRRTRVSAPPITPQIRVTPDKGLMTALHRWSLHPLAVAPFVIDSSEPEAAYEMGGIW